MMRGYRVLRVNNLLQRIMDAQIALVEMPLGIPESKISRHLFGSTAKKANEAIRDFLITRVGHYSLNKSLLSSLGKKKGHVVHPLPKIWRRKIQSLGWQVSEIKSALVWHGFLFLCFSYGIFLLGKNILKGFYSSFLPGQKVLGKYVCFSGLTKNNLPQQIDDDSYETVSWYLQWQGRQAGIKTIGHNVKNVQEIKMKGVNIRFTDPLAPLRGFGKNCCLFVWGFSAACVCLVDWLKGRWWSSLMFAPCVQAFIAKHQPTFAVDYLFPNSYSRKPLWLYEVEARGAKTSLYFYSTNCDSFKTKQGYQPTPAYYRNMNWSRYLVWDQEQVSFVCRSVESKAEIKIVGPIWSSESTAVLPDLSSRTVGVFDIQPRRKSIYEALGVPLEYYTPAIGEKFLKDIHEVVGQKDLIMAWKGKRKLPSGKTRQLAKSFESACKKMAASRNILVIDPDIAATRLIKKCALVISMPFTSTALIAKDLGKPSYYYDPSCLIQKDDRASHGIPIISGIDELRLILETALEKIKYKPADLCSRTMEFACDKS